MRLMDLQSYVADLSKAYLEHANNVINGGPATIDIPPMHAGVGGLNLPLRAGGPGVKFEAGEKKRKRAPPDPNAPKRALTPYFLFMQHNRAKIAADLGAKAKPKDVADEGTKRWQEMSSLEKEVHLIPSVFFIVANACTNTGAIADLEEAVRRELREV